MMSSTSPSTSSSMGPITGEDIVDAYYAGGFSSTTHSKVGLSPFENHSLLRLSAVGEADRNSEGHVTASEFHVIGNYSSVTASDDPCGLLTSLSLALINPFTDYEYGSELEVSETHFDTSKVGEMSQDDESVRVLADRALPSASRVALRVAAQITEEE